MIFIETDIGLLFAIGSKWDVVVLHKIRTLISAVIERACTTGGTTNISTGAQVFKTFVCVVGCVSVCCWQFFINSLRFIGWCT